MLTGLAGLNGPLVRPLVVPVTDVNNEAAMVKISRKDTTAMAMTLSRNLV